MLKYGYCKKLSTGVICASGTLGQIIPPSIVLIILGDVLGVAVGDLFKAAVMPGLVLVGSYIAYVLVVSYYNKDLAPAMPVEENVIKSEEIIKALKAIIPPLSLIIIVLGSIFVGIATPTESSAVGGIGALLLAVIYKQYSIKIVKDAALETVKITAMVFTILLGATAFSMVFSYTGGEELVEHFMTNLPGEKWGFIGLVMLSILILGFFIDFVEITFIVIPIIYPIAQLLGIDMVWFGILIAMNLQTSFLTPPFGFALFYLKGVAPAGVKTMDIYKGVMPFILIQIIILASIVIFPEFYGFSGFGE
jgi:tripartite ATP-independent transporter DctM subunit